MRYRLRFAAAVMAVLALLAFSPVSDAQAQEQPEPPTWFVDETRLPFDPLPGFEDAVQHWGIHQDAGFRVEVPADWNGDLVMWAHGFRGDGLELTVDNHPIREYLLANGYAWGASSYTENGYNVLSGVKSTARLARMTERDLLPQEPNRVYVTGASMGGHVTALSIERFSNLYDGALPICGVLGDYHLFDFFLDFNLVAQQLGTGSAQLPVDPAVYFGSTVPSIISNLEALPGTWPLALNESGEQLKTFTEIVTGGDRPNYDEAWAFWNSGDLPFLFTLGVGDGTLPNSNGQSVLNNAWRNYRLDFEPGISADEEALNAALPRLTVEPGARKSERISGNISDPVLTLHNLGDLFVPFDMEIRYAIDVAEAGNSDLLVQRAIRGVGHCDFTDFELETGFGDLVRWVEDGLKPGGDVILDRAAVADEDYGCAFSDPDPSLHILAVPCAPR